MDSQNTQSLKLSFSLFRPLRPGLFIAAVLLLQCWIQCNQNGGRSTQGPTKNKVGCLAKKKKNTFHQQLPTALRATGTRNTAIRSSTCAMHHTKMLNKAQLQLRSFQLYLMKCQGPSGRLDETSKESDLIVSLKNFPVPCHRLWVVLRNGSR